MMTTREEARAIAESVLRGQPRSYVEAARLLAAFLLAEPNSRSAEPTRTEIT